MTESPPRSPTACGSLDRPRPEACVSSPCPTLLSRVGAAGFSPEGAFAAGGGPARLMSPPHSPTACGSLPSAISVVVRDAQARGLERLDAQILLLHALGRNRHDRAWLMAHDDTPLEAAVRDAFSLGVQRRLSGEPVAYITGRQEFFGLDLHVDARVLVPRPDTETLVEWALALLAGRVRPRVLDLGTGSGAIALAIQQHCPEAEVWAVDASVDALAVAQHNAQRLALDRVQFVQSHWFDRLPTAPGFDLVLSNPPYIRSDDDHLKTLGFEPQHALTSGSDGLDDIRHIIRHAGQHLAAGGWLLLEHGHDQCASVQALFAGGQSWAEVQSRSDLAGIARCTGACFRSAG